MKENEPKARYSVEIPATEQTPLGPVEYVWHVVRTFNTREKAVAYLRQSWGIRDEHAGAFISIVEGIE